MSGEAREKLNNRFQKIYHLLVKRGEIIKNDRKKSLSAFAEKILGKRRGFIIKNYLDGERFITYDQAMALCEHYGVSKEFMFHGKGEPFETESDWMQALEERVSPDFVSEPTPTGNILYSTIDAFASSTVDVQSYEETERFHIPGLQGAFVAFTINGDSMAPTIRSGDLVICQPLDSYETIRDNEIYAVVTAQSVMVKRIRREYDSQNHLTSLKLISDNYIEHDPFEVDLGEVRQVLRVVRRLTGLDEY